MDSEHEREDAELDAIIVLGGGPDDGRRAEAAERYYDDADCRVQSDPVADLDRLPFIVATGGSTVYLEPTRRAPFASRMLAQLTDLPDELLIQEDFKETIEHIGGNPDLYAYSGSCDIYTNILTGLHSLQGLKRTGKIGLVGCDDTMKRSLAIANRISSQEFVGIPSFQTAGHGAKAYNCLETRALLCDMDRFGVVRDDLSSHYLLLGAHPALEESFNKTNKKSFYRGMVESVQAFRTR